VGREIGQAGQTVGREVGELGQSIGQGFDKAGSSMENMLKQVLGGGGGGGGDSGRGRGLLGERPEAINSLARGAPQGRQALLMPAKPAATPFVSPSDTMLQNLQQFAVRSPTRGGRWAAPGDALSGASPITQAAAGPGSSAAGGPASQMPQNKGKQLMGQVKGLMSAAKPGGKIQQQPYQAPPPMAPLQTPPVPQIAGGRAWVPPSRGQGNDGLEPWEWYRLLRRRRIA
jgi:hypothetical protein